MLKNAQYEQKDPLLIYKTRKGMIFFKDMLDKLNKDIISFLMKAQLPVENETKKANQSRNNFKAPPKQDLSKLKTGRERCLGQATEQNAQMAKKKNQGENRLKRQPVSVLKRPGRNERVKVS